MDTFNLLDIKFIIPINTTPISDKIHKKTYKFHCVNHLEGEYIFKETMSNMGLNI